MGEASETQAGLRAALVADPGVFALIGDRVVDEPGPDCPLPFVRFQEIEPVPDDTDGLAGAVVSVGIEVHSRPAAGRIEAQAICEAIKAALHRKPEAVAAAGFRVFEVEVQTFTVTRQGDGATYRGALAIEVHLHKAA